MEAVTYKKLSQITESIDSAIQDAFKSELHWVIAEVSEHNHYPNKHSHYFELVEKEQDSDGIVAKISCVAWRDGSVRIKKFEEATGQQFKKGINVLIQVAVIYHAVYGLKLQLKDIDPAFTIGMLEQQRQATLRRLLTDCQHFVCKRDGRFITNNNQLRLQPVIQKLAVISSSASAGLEDFVHTLKTNLYSYSFSIDYYYTVVQGEANAELLYSKFIDIFNSKVPYDAVVLIRGGGSQSDFLIFDQYILGKVAAKFPIPIITGLGHHKNESIVDLMVHTPTKTPTKAAEFIVAHNRNFEDSISKAQSTIVIKAQQSIAKALQRLSSLNRQLSGSAKSTTVLYQEKLSCIHQNLAHHTKLVLYEKRSGLHSLSCRITTLPELALARRSHELSCEVTSTSMFVKMNLTKQQNHLDQIDAICRLMNPENILKKGFAILYYQDQITPSGKDIPLGAGVLIQLSDMKMAATITAKNNPDEPADL